MAAAVDTRVFKEDGRSKVNAQGKAIALCAHGKQGAASCHEGECNRDASAARKKCAVDQQIRRDLGIDNSINNTKRRRDLGTDNGTNNAKRRKDLGTDNGTNNAKIRKDLGVLTMV